MSHHPLLAPGSVGFAGTNGRITQDNSNLFYDDTNNRLGLGTNSTLGGRLTMQSTAAMEGATVTDVTPTAGWTSAGWTTIASNSYTHVGGNSSTLDSNYAAVIGQKYMIRVQVATGTGTLAAQRYTISMGGTSFGAPDCRNVGVNCYISLIATTTATLQVATTSLHRRNITLTLYTVTAGTESLVSIKGNNSVENFQMRTTPDFSVTNYQPSVFFGKLNGQSVYSVSGTNTINPTTQVYGAGNCGIGPNNMPSLVTGTNMTCIGNNNLPTYVGGEYSTAVGTFNGNAQTNGDYFTYVGYSNFSANTTGRDNQVFGYSNTSSAPTTSSSVTLGRSNVGYSTSVAVGLDNGLGYVGETGTNYSVVLGIRNLVGNSVGAYSGLKNVAIGNNALNTNADLTGQNNLHISCGSTSVTSPTQDVGSHLLQLTTGSYNTLIGFIPAATATTLGNFSNNVILADGQGNIRIRSVLGKTGIGLGTTDPTATLHLAAGTAAANTAPLKLSTGVNTTVAEAGAIEYDGSDLQFTDSGLTRAVIARRIYALTTSGSGGASSTAAFSVIGTGVGTVTIPTNTLKVGTTVSVDASGLYTKGGGNLTCEILVGGVVVGTTSAQNTGGAATPESWDFEYNFTIRSLGAAGTMFGQGNIMYVENVNMFTLKNTATNAVNTTIANAIDLRFTWASSNAINNVTCTNLIVTLT